jgi:hypothetical protein
MISRGVEMVDRTLVLQHLKPAEEHVAQGLEHIGANEKSLSSLSVTVTRRSKREICSRPFYKRKRCTSRIWLAFGESLENSRVAGRRGLEVTTGWILGRPVRGDRSPGYGQWR